MTELQKEMYKKAQRFMNDSVIDLLGCTDIDSIHYIADEEDDDSISIETYYTIEGAKIKSHTCMKNEDIPEGVLCYLDESGIDILVETAAVDEHLCIDINLNQYILSKNSIIIIPEVDESLLEYIDLLSASNIYNTKSLTIKFKKKAIEEIHTFIIKVKLYMIKEDTASKEEVKRIINRHRSGGEI